MSYETAHGLKMTWQGSPRQHQIDGVMKAAEQGDFAFFWEPGCGKTYATLHLAKGRFTAGEIDLVVIICPNSVKQVWPREIVQWCEEIPTHTQVMSAGDAPKRSATQSPHLEFLILAVESLSQGKMYERVMAYIKGRKAMCVVDESSRIKNPAAFRTKQATAIGWSCFFRLILTGTPVNQGPHDLYAQFRYLDPAIIGMKKWTAFRNRYCEIGGFENRQIVGYQNLDELMDKIRPYSQYVRLEDCTDIPEKIYQTVAVPLSVEQKRAIKELKNEGSLTVESMGVELFVEMALERMTRCQQILGGSLPYWDEEDEVYKTVPMPGGIPKMDAMMDYIEDLPETAKCLVFARFTPERDRICAALEKAYGPKAVVRIDGQVTDEDRIVAVDRIQKDPTCRFFVGNQTVAGIGLTLTAAKYTLLFSNTFSHEDRVQLENRNHRMGQTDHCVYVDFEAQCKEDTMILKAIHSKKSMAQLVRDSIERREFEI